MSYLALGTSVWEGGHVWQVEPLKPEEEAFLQLGNFMRTTLKTFNKFSVQSVFLFGYLGSCKVYKVANICDLSHATYFVSGTKFNIVNFNKTIFVILQIALVLL